MASKQAVARVIREIFGSVPTSRTHRGVRHGLDVLSKTQTGPYDRRYFLDPIEPHARKVRVGSSWCVMLRESGIACVGTIEGGKLYYNGYDESSMLAPDRGRGYYAVIDFPMAMLITFCSPLNTQQRG